MNAHDIFEKLSKKVSSSKHVQQSLNTLWLEMRSRGDGGDKEMLDIVHKAKESAEARLSAMLIEGLA